MERSDGDLVVRVEMPGLDPDRDVEISLSGRRLRIRAERRRASETHGPSGYRSELHHDSVVRTVTLPEGVMADDVAASYRDGVLEVRVSIGGAAPSVHRIDVTGD